MRIEPANASDFDIRDRAPVDRRLGIVMGVVAATLGVGAFVHLGGYTPGGTKPPFDASHAGTAEAIIGTVLAGGAVAVLRRARHARKAAIITTTFGIVGFVVGLNFTARGGDAADVVYHLVTLPVLVLTLIFVRRTPRRAGAASAER